MIKFPIVRLVIKIIPSVNFIGIVFILMLYGLRASKSPDFSWYFYSRWTAIGRVFITLVYMGISLSWSVLRALNDYVFLCAVVSILLLEFFLHLFPEIISTDKLALLPIEARSKIAHDRWTNSFTLLPEVWLKIIL